ncbi:MAG: Sir2 family NAD-dependent protein deacetylase [Chloroflexota bacterium]
MSLSDAISLLQQAKHAVALTGAGISTPSGIPDFRSPASGLWEKADPMEVASIWGFQRNPEAFYAWLHPLSKLTMDAKPNAAHVALVDLEAHGPLKAIITQNIDMLHTRAGSQTVYEVHGHMREATCLSCLSVFEGAPFWERFTETAVPPRCPNCNSIVKPNTILFGELLPQAIMQAAEDHVAKCDVMLAIGSSLEVAPVGDLPLRAKRRGAKLIIINLGRTHADRLADVVIRADVVEALPQLAAVFKEKDVQS